jgi:hypothetical protein
MLKITSAASSPAWQKAMARAKANFDAGLVATCVGERKYQVPSANSGGVYTVEVINPGQLLASCTCPCGTSERAGVHCWHVAQVLSLEIARLSKPVDLDAAIARIYAQKVA